MARKGDPHLLKVGAEAFGLLEENFPSRYPPPQWPQQPRQFPPEEAVLNHLEAGKKYGGFVDPRKRKPVLVRKVYYYEVV